MKRFIFFISFVVVLSSFIFTAGGAQAKGKQRNSHLKEAEQAEIDKEKPLYRLKVGDVLKIDVYQEPNLSGEFEVRRSGMIVHPLLNKVPVENLTKVEAEEKVVYLLGKDYLVNPIVRVNLVSFKNQVLLIGHVASPGTISLPESKTVTLLEIITQQGGFTGYASVNGTKIVRTKADGGKIIINARMNDIINGRKEDIGLRSGDVIIVPERLF